MLILCYGNFTSVFNKRSSRWFAAAVSREETGAHSPRLQRARQKGQKAPPPSSDRPRERGRLGWRRWRRAGPGVQNTAWGFLSRLQWDEIITPSPGSPTKPALKSVQPLMLGMFAGKRHGVRHLGWRSRARAQRAGLGSRWTRRQLISGFHEKENSIWAKMMKGRPQSLTVNFKDHWRGLSEGGRARSVHANTQLTSTVGVVGEKERMSVSPEDPRSWKSWRQGWAAEGQESSHLEQSHCRWAGSARLRDKTLN